MLINPYRLALPEGWDHVALKFLADIETGSGDTQDADPDGEFSFIVRSPDPLRSSTYSYDTEAVLTAGDGNVGEIFHHIKGKFHAHQRVYVLHNFKRVIPRYCFFFFSAFFRFMAQGGEARTTVDSVRRWMLADMPFAVPPLDEQRVIADYLDRETRRIDELIAEQRGLIETLRERRRGATFWLLSGLDVGGDRWSSDSFVFPSLPAGWGTVALGQIGDSKSGSGFPPAHQGQQGGELQYYKVKHLGLADSADVINGADDTISRQVAVSLRAHVFPAGTIVYAKVGAALMLGRIRTLGVEGCIDNNMAGFTPFDVADSRYVQLAMSAIPFDYLVNPGAVPSLSDKKLMAMKIPFPSPQVRHAIARSIDDQTSRIDALIAESEDLIALSQERRAALITAAVTGQIDVRTAA